MAEAVGIVLGVLPIIFEALKAYRSTYDKISTFRQCSKELEWIHMRLRVRKLRFFNSCWLLLHLKIEQDEKLQEMFAGESEQLWYDKDLNEQMDGALGIARDLCEAIVKDIKACLQDIERDLSCLETVRTKKAAGESVRKAFHRLRQSLTIVFEKSQFVKRLDCLRHQNEELKGLLNDLADLQNHQAEGKMVKPCTIRRTLVTHYGTIQRAAQKLHEALADAWCCTDLGHTEHYAKLFVDAEVGSGVNLNLAISYRQRAPCTSGSHAIEDPRTWLLIQSTSTENNTLTTTRKRKVYFADENGIDDLSNVANVRSIKHTASSSVCLTAEVTVARPSKPQLSFSRAEDSTSNPAQTPLTTVIDLCQSRNVCHDLKHHTNSCRDSQSNQCVGYLDSRNQFRHLFYCPGPRSTLTNPEGSDSSRRFLSLKDVMRQTPSDTLDLADQLKLAIKLTKGVLQFHSTPWLEEGWRIQDLAFFEHRNQLSEVDFDTLHLTSELSNRNPKETPPLTVMEGVESTSLASLIPFEDPAIDLGINNLTLFNLGAALLQIGCWKNLDELRQQKDLHEVHTIRRASNGRLLLGLGGKYRNIVQKCLRCNFGFGSDLKEETLLSAINSQVISPLEGMIDALTL